jgi:subtilase family serine protease
MSTLFAAASRSAAIVSSSLLMCSSSFTFANAPDPGHSHPLLVQALPQAAKNGAMHASGRLKGSRRLDLAIHLPARNQSELDELIRELYDPASPNYHNYLSVDEFTARFGTTQSDYDEVAAWANA